MNQSHYDFIANTLDTKVADYYRKIDVQETSEHTSLKVGDVVTFTNMNGVTFRNQIVLGFDKEITNGRFIFTAERKKPEAYWFSSSLESLSLQ
jgi:hypothetical protein